MIQRHAICPTTDDKLLERRAADAAGSRNGACVRNIVDEYRRFDAGASPVRPGVEQAAMAPALSTPRSLPAGMN
jgi:hypothetical protein